jgi:hypothetical protein
MAVREMMRMHNKIVLVAALALAGCGNPIEGGDDAGDTPDLSVGGNDLTMVGGCSPKCTGLAPKCNATNHCVGCLGDADCAMGTYCKIISDAVASCTPGCMSDDRCANAQKCCGMQCVDTNSDARNCGMCASACKAVHSGSACVGGQCQGGKCDPGWGDCNNDPMDGCESNLHADAANCTMCGAKCDIPNAYSGCADGCYATACKWGFDDCNMNPMDGCETSVLSDVKNCGSCGKSCNNLANAMAGCVSGNCVLSSCVMGYSDCDMNAANGCEVKVATDANNCGACGMACPMGNICVAGQCTCPMCNIPNASAKCINNVCVLDKCNAGYADCDNNQMNGCEVFISGDKNNCGGCGKACQQGLSCVGSMCQMCNSNVLIIGDDQPAADQTLADDLTKGGLTPTLFKGGGMDGSVTYVGQPDPAGFGAVIILVGNLYDKDMPQAGQQAIVNANTNSGTGVIFSEWGAYQVSSARWQTLKNILVLTRTSGITSTQTYTLEVMNHSIWTGLPASWKTVNAMGGNSGSALANGGVRIAGCAECGNGAGVVVKDGPGRVVQHAHAGNYMQGGVAWTNDANLIKLMVNSANWATKCLQ